MTTTVLRTENPALKVAIVPVDMLRPHEKGSPLYLELLRKEILRDGRLKYPIIADENTHVILDGMHRWLALKSLGYRLIPVMFVDVYQKPAIHVGTRRIHQYRSDNGEMTIEEVLSVGLSGRLLPPRSTRHFFPFSKFQLINYPLDLLNRGSPSDVSQYLAKMTTRQCGLAVNQWLDEMREELEFLTNRKAEVEREREEFLNRIKNTGKN